MKKEELIDKYKKLYYKVQTIAEDKEVFPDLIDEQFKEFVSKNDWMGVPSFSISKKEMTNSDQGHIAISLKRDIFWINVWFNSTKAVERFAGILSPVQKKEREELIDFLKKLDNKYKITINYAEKFYSAGAKWQPLLEVNCNNLTDKDIENILQTIKNAKEKRSSRQKELPKSQIATLSVALAEIELDIKNEREVTEAILNSTRLFKIVHNLKSISAVRKEEFNRPLLIKSLEDKKKRIELGFDEESTQEDYEGIVERIKKLKGK
ncbi:MAG: hypothetical protein AABX29_06995 [Nanoarchaeota archaeon]